MNPSLEEQNRRDHKRQLYRNLFSTRTGRQILEDLTRVFGLFRSSVSEGKMNALETFYREGARSVLLYILRNCGVFDGENKNFDLAFFLHVIDNFENKEHMGEETDGTGEESDKS